MNLKRLFSMRRSLIKFNVALLFCFIVIATVFFIIPQTGFAQVATDQNLTAFGESAGIATTMSLPTIIGRIVQIFLAVLGIILILLIIYGGFIWMSSQGDPGKVEKAKKIIINAIIGVIIISLAFAIATFVMGILNGTFRGGSRSGTIPGGPDDWNRSMIGRGPIESVYPTPNQKDVSIDTQVVVTFKEAIDLGTIITASSTITDNIEICEVDTNYNCVTSSPTTLGKSDYLKTPVVSTPDKKTFVFTPEKYLGFNDGVNRVFKVLLKSGIKKVNDESVFKGGYYEWVFETNGKIDLNPPQIVASEVFPNPDPGELENGGADIYSMISQPKTGTSTIDFQSSDFGIDLPFRIGKSPTTLSGFIDKAFSIELEALSGNIPPEHIIYLKTDSGFEFNTSTPVIPTEITVHIENDGLKATIGGHTFLKLASNKIDIVGSGRINFGNGLYIESNGGPFVQGSNWHFYIANKADGKKFIINVASTTEYGYLFTDRNETRDKITKDGKQYFTVKSSSTATSTLKNLADKINSTANQSVVASSTGPSLRIAARYAGAEGNKINIIKPDGTLINLEGGESRNWGRGLGVKGPFDPYNNSYFQFTFNKAINPISFVDGTNNIIIKFKNNNGEMTEIKASSSISNQYKTITLKGPHECGTNSCGETMTCWMTSTPEFPTSTKFEIEIAAAQLRTCDGVNDGWCGNQGSNSAGFGGTCQANQRCSKVVDGKTIFFPKTTSSTSGISDLAGNSFNGSFDTFTDTLGKVLGIAQGRSDCSEPGCSNQGVFPFVTSSPVATSTLGDNLRWSFFLSSEIDKTSPLINEIFPVGGKEFGLIIGEQANQPVEAKFDRLMDSSSFKPGWGYSASTTAKEWFNRFFVLSTVNKGANPIGYWVGKRDGDGNNDGWADYTRALIFHNNYDNSVQYGPLVGSAIRSITQNCFLPGSGPKFGGDTTYSGSSNDCKYTSESATSTSGCVSDMDLNDNRIRIENPASYAHMRCDQIGEGAVVCPDNKSCEPFYNNTDPNIKGSWIITIDHPTASTTRGGRTGCCFGKCQ